MAQAYLGQGTSKYHTHGYPPVQLPPKSVCSRCPSPRSSDVGYSLTVRWSGMNYARRSRPHKHFFLRTPYSSWCTLVAKRYRQISPVLCRYVTPSFSNECALIESLPFGSHGASCDRKRTNSRLWSSSSHAEPSLRGRTLLRRGLSLLDIWDMRLYSVSDALRNLFETNARRWSSSRPVMQSPRLSCRRQRPSRTRYHASLAGLGGTYSSHTPVFVTQESSFSVCLRRIAVVGTRLSRS